MHTFLSANFLAIASYRHNQYLPAIFVTFPARSSHRLLPIHFFSLLWYYLWSTLLITAGTSWFLVITAFWDDFYRNHGYCYPVICRNVYRKNILGYVQFLFCMLVTAGTSWFLGISCGFGPQEGTAFLQEITT